MKEITLAAPAKINLILDVVGERADGYHTLRSVMQTLSLSDRVTLRFGGAPGIRVSADLPGLSCGPDNLAFRAAGLLAEEFAPDAGIDIFLKKNIPMAAGLAGGSSDAAAVLLGINEALELGLTLPELCERGLALGADLPFCLTRGTALAEGIGEEITPLSPLPRLAVLLVKPAAGLSTPAIYRALPPAGKLSHPDVEGMLLAIKEADLPGILSRLGNVLELPAFGSLPELSLLKEELLAAGAGGALMSGSGPTVFGLFSNLSAAEEAEKKLRKDHPEHFVKLTFPASAAEIVGPEAVGK